MTFDFKKYVLKGGFCIDLLNSGSKDKDSKYLLNNSILGQKDRVDKQESEGTPETRDSRPKQHSA